MSKKDLAVGFLKLVAARSVRQAYDKYIAAEFIHHNQFFKGDRQTLMTAMQEAAREKSMKDLNIKQVFEDGDFVIVHSHIKQFPEDRGGIVVHIFKFKDDKVVELWDMGQPIIEDSPNEHGPF